MARSGKDWYAYTSIHASPYIGYNSDTLLPTYACEGKLSYPSSGFVLVNDTMYTKSLRNRNH